LIGESEFDEFLDVVYGAAFEPGGWETAIARFADLVGSAVAWMPTLSLTDLSGTGVLARIDPERQESYFQHYSAVNPYLSRGPSAIRQPWPLLILTNEDYFPPDFLRRTEYYNDFLRPQQIESVAVIRLARHGQAETTLNLARPPHKGPFSKDDLNLAARLQPHLVRALRINQSLGSRALVAGHLADMLDQSPHGVFLLDASGRIRHANRQAERLLAERDGLCAVGGRLGAAGSGPEKPLDALIRRAAGRGAGECSGGSMLLQTPSRTRPLSITVAPLRSERLAGPTGPWVLVCVTDLEANVALPENRLRDLFGLTRAEARVALALFEGASPREIAETLDVSFRTVRNQITRIFEKTQTHRQSELARLMMRLLGVAGL
jgi:DNA-binding CsgD family transcriptional regulator/PAS domain-containing protein